MGLIIYGHSSTAIGVDEVLVYCPCCEKDAWADLMVESVYFHVYWLPIFPFDKVANLICEECGTKRFGLAFDARLIRNYTEIKGKFRHPLRTFLALAIVAFSIFASVTVSALGRHH